MPCPSSLLMKMVLNFMRNPKLMHIFLIIVVFTSLSLSVDEKTVGTPLRSLNVREETTLPVRIYMILFV